MMIERTPKANLPAPFNLADVALHCRLDPSDIEVMAEAGRFAMAGALEVEGRAALSLLDHTIRVTLEGWPRGASLALPIAPMLDPLSVTVRADGKPFEAFAVTSGQRPSIRLTGPRPCGPIVIEYEAGYGVLASDIPGDLTVAILDQAVAFYDDRGAGNGKGYGLSPHAARVIARYRRVAL